MDHLHAPLSQLTGGSTNAIGLVINSSNPLLSLNGGTGVNNGSSTFIMGGNVTFSGAFPFVGTVSASTSVTFPTSGTLVNNAVTTLSNLASIGTITTGTWNGSVISGIYGGTGVNNGSSTFTMGGNVAFSGAFTFTGTLTGATSITFPTSGTLSTLGNNGISSQTISGTSFTLTTTALQNEFVVTNASLVTLTLPTTFAVGQKFVITGSGAGGWKIAQNAGQSIAYQSGSTTTATTVGTGGSLSSTLYNDCVILTAIVANTTLTISGTYANNLSGV